MGKYARMMAAGSVLAVLFFVLSLSVGRFYVPFDQVAAILASNFIELPITWDASMYNVVMVIRLPRVLGDILVGVALAVSGAAYQGVFRNDLVLPDLLGVSQGASVGACLAILVHLTLGGTAVAAFLGGIAAVTMTLMLPKLVQSRSRISRSSPIRTSRAASVSSSCSRRHSRKALSSSSSTSRQHTSTSATRTASSILCNDLMRRASAS